tara:strand:- start:24 stop:509 length:486 start_codon:yes stop_codon:yes gene_type:complete
MNTEIKIVDNFLDQKDIQKITTNNLTWNLQTSNLGKGELTFLMSEKTDDKFFNTCLFDKVVDKLDKGSYELERVYFNGQWNGREGSIHSDNCDITVLIYTSNYEYGWGGFTEIMTEPEPTLVYPIPNRLVIFPGNILHKAYSFAYQYCPIRTTLAFKINKK